MTCHFGSDPKATPRPSQLIAGCFGGVEGRAEHFPTLEFQVGCLDEEVREEFGRREASLWTSSFPRQTVVRGSGESGGPVGQEEGGRGSGQAEMMAGA